MPWTATDWDGSVDRELSSDGQDGINYKYLMPKEAKYTKCKKDRAILKCQVTKAPTDRVVDIEWPSRKRGWRINTPSANRSMSLNRMTEPKEGVGNSTNCGPIYVLLSTAFLSSKNTERGQKRREPEKEESNYHIYLDWLLRSWLVPSGWRMWRRCVCFVASQT